MKEVQDLLYVKLVCVWGKITDNMAELKKQLKEEIYNNGEDGANTLLDWCRDDFEKYEEESEIYQEIENVWDWCNWYLDYLQGNINKEKILYLLKESENFTKSY